MLILVPTRMEAKRLFEGRVPVDERPVPTRIGSQSCLGALTGFGPAAAGVLASQALWRSGTSRAILAGIAGSFDVPSLPVGALLTATEVRTADIGRGRGEGHRGPVETNTVQAPGEGNRRVLDRLVLPHADPAAGPAPGVLLTVAAAAATPEQAAERRRRHPDARAEDMEAFSVALAATRLGIPLAVLRGVSNEVGEPDRALWRVDEALAGVRDFLAASAAALFRSG